MNGVIKLAAISMALLVALMLLDMSFNLVAVGIKAPGEDRTSGSGSSGQPATGPGGNSPAGGSPAGSGGSNPLTGAGGSLPDVPKEVLAPAGLLWWLLGRSGIGMPSGVSAGDTSPGGVPATILPDGGNPGMPDNNGGSVPGITGPDGTSSTGTGAGSTGSSTPADGASGGTGTGTGALPSDNAGGGSGSTSSTGGSGQGTPAGTGETTSTSRNGTGIGAGEGPWGSGIPEWLLPLFGGFENLPGGGTDGSGSTTPGESASVLLPDGTVLSRDSSSPDTITTITGYPEPVSKSNGFTVSGRVTGIDGTPVIGMIVEIYLAKDKAAPGWIKVGETVDVSGDFVADCRAPANVTPGEYHLLARALGNKLYRGSDSDPVVSLVSETRVRVAAPEKARAGDEFVVEGTLIENATGLPLKGQPIDVSVGLVSGRGFTGDDGVARVKVKPLSGGNVTIVATYPGQDGYLRSSAGRVIAISGTSLIDMVLYWIIAAAILLISSVIAYIVYRTTRRWRSADNLLLTLLDSLLSKLQRKPHVEATAPPDQFFEPGPPSPFSISFPDIEGLLPAVWGTGDALRTRVSGPPGTSLDLLVDGQKSFETTLTAGEATVPLTLAKGDHRLSVGGRGGGAELAVARVRVVDYREEIVRLFNELCGRVRSRFPAVEMATPRELMGAVGPHVPEPGNRHLDRVISIFEVANYSLHGVGREEYVKSYLSIRELSI